MMSKIKELYTWLTSDKINAAKILVKEDKEYIEKLYKKHQVQLEQQTNDYLIRSFLQYKCQMEYLSSIKKVVLNLVSIIGLPILLIFALYNNSQLKPAFTKGITAVINGDVDEELIPDSLKPKLNLVKCSNNYLLTLNLHSLLWILEIVPRHILNPYFIFKLVTKIAQYNSIVHKYNYPMAIITTSEYSFCSSALTLYLQDLGVQHINVMHGEKLFNIRDSFFKFSECYIWDEHYIDLLTSLKAPKEQFIVEQPPKHKRIIELGKKCQVIKNIIKFYWASEYEELELLYISQYLKGLSQAGFKILIRYHPLHREYFIKSIAPYFQGIELEDPKIINIYDSLINTEYVFGTYTTVLYEAYLMNKKIIINDYNYEMLKELKYIVVYNDHFRLSEFCDVLQI